ncbi:hypothetical protein CYMTET_39445 [Cymbomonas tetramitiformis]|uniref:C2 domain-containing protein n=1 Tax=Cymbomonas tetramitiformis TaxID=36881 RepID=A0AAE0CC54_9CHLO|nr:hypothetical protein CYMTET_39445 [Cymbomonas tetramitiformis]|eukprot:gene7508-8936_t
MDINEFLSMNFDFCSCQGRVEKKKFLENLERHAPASAVWSSEGMQRNLVIKVIKASNLPKMDIVGVCDPFVRMWITDENLIKKTEKYSTVTHNETADATFNAIREIEYTHESNDVLHLEVFDEDLKTQSVELSDFIGRILVPIEDIVPGHVYNLPLRDDAGRETQSRLSFSRLTQPLVTRKRLFLVRHGESEWNEAQEKKHLVNMMKQVDHPLNGVGIAQAQELQAKWKPRFDKMSQTLKETRNTSEDSWEADFFCAEKVFASPLTRAVQTALLALTDHPAITEAGITLMRNLREVKNAGSRDTVGKAVGDDIRSRALGKLSKQLPGEDLAKLDKVTFDDNDVKSEWWLGTEQFEGEKDVKTRLHDVASSLKYEEAQNIILAGHSLYFRSFVREFIGSQCRVQQPELSQQLIKHKLANGACLGLEVEFSNILPTILSAKLMFGTKVANGKEDGHQEPASPAEALKVDVDTST